uniref:Cephalotocin n=2 Tax=Octopus TaxID=6643 RepID=Q76DN0_OCTVU|nr:cephalotocin [Octopus vulgaris]BAC84978.1 cephalotocin precursor [Octopus vulgaris]BAD93373.1 cephalotocin [Octopus vulgaris]
MSQNCFAIVQLLFVLFTVCSLFIATTDGCYFRNCPIGGKRATPMSEQGSNQKCMSCGPNGEGQCVGSNICCHKDGCIIGTLAKECNEENESTTACSVKGVPCGTDGQGRCVADGVCCDESSCFTTDRCDRENHRSMAMQKLLEIRDGIYYKK